MTTLPVPSNWVFFISGHDSIIESTNGAYLRNSHDLDGKPAQDDHDDKGVHKVCQKGRAKASKVGVNGHSKLRTDRSACAVVLEYEAKIYHRQQVNARHDVHARQRSHGRTSPQQHAREDEHIINKAKDDPEYVHRGAVSLLDQLEQGVRVRRPALGLDRDER